MQPFIALILIALLAGCVSTPETPRPASLHPVEAVALTSFACKGEAAILELADADARSDKERIEAFRRLHRQRVCGLVRPAQRMPLTQLIHEYADFSGVQTQVRRIGQSEYFTLAILNGQQKQSRYQPVHGDAEWIQNHPRHSWCCGVDDCHRLDPKAVSRRGNEYVVEWEGRTHPVPIREAKPSIDADYWLCIRSGPPICLFHPNLGV